MSNNANMPTANLLVMPQELRLRVIGVVLDHILHNEFSPGFLDRESVDELMIKYIGVNVDDAMKLIDHTVSSFFKKHFISFIVIPDPPGFSRKATAKNKADTHFRIETRTVEAIEAPETSKEQQVIIEEVDKNSSRSSTPAIVEQPKIEEKTEENVVEYPDPPVELASDVLKNEVKNMMTKLNIDDSSSSISGDDIYSTPLASPDAYSTTPIFENLLDRANEKSIPNMDENKENKKMPKNIPDVDDIPELEVNFDDIVPPQENKATKLKNEKRKAEIAQKIEAAKAKQEKTSSVKTVDNSQKGKESKKEEKASNTDKTKVAENMLTDNKNKEKSIEAKTEENKTTEKLPDTKKEESKNKPAEAKTGVKETDAQIAVKKEEKKTKSTTSNESTSSKSSLSAESSKSKVEKKESSPSSSKTSASPVNEVDKKSGKTMPDSITRKSPKPESLNVDEVPTADISHLLQTVTVKPSSRSSKKSSVSSETSSVKAKKGIDEDLLKSVAISAPKSTTSSIKSESKSSISTSKPKKKNNGSVINGEEIDFLLQNSQVTPTLGRSRSPVSQSDEMSVSSSKASSVYSSRLHNIFYKLQGSNIINYQEAFTSKKRIADNVSIPPPSHLLNMWYLNFDFFAELVLLFQYIYKFTLYGEFDLQAYQRLLECASNYENIFNSCIRFAEHVELMFDLKFILIDENTDQRLIKINPELLNFQMYPLATGVPSTLTFVLLHSKGNVITVNNLRGDFICDDELFVEEVLKELNRRPDIYLLENPKNSKNIFDMIIRLNPRICKKFFVLNYELRDFRCAKDIHLRRDELFDSISQFESPQ